MKPSKKSLKVDDTLTKIFGFDRKESIKSNKCVPPPIGCGKSIDIKTEFKDRISLNEFSISGLCAACQQRIFGE